MWLRFTGTYTGKRNSITTNGVTFVGREPSLVTDAEALRRLSSHPEFEKAEKAKNAENELLAPKRGRPRKVSDGSDT